MKILHIAPINVAGVPFAMMDMQKRFGHEARLVTLHKNELSFPEDICLDIPLLRHRAVRRWRDRSNAASQSGSIPPTMSPSAFERVFLRFDDHLRKATVRKAIQDYRLDEYSIIHYDGGLDLFRDARVAQEWKNRGKHIVCHYMGSDLRLRGVHPIIDRLSELNLTNESDHLQLHPDIHYLYIPFDASSYQFKEEENTTLRIIHSPSRRSMKGTELILPVIEQLQKIRKVDFVLVENTPHAEVLRIKQSCDLAIEQVGNMGGTGYGRNSLENLALGLPTVTEMTSDYVEWLPENPFVLADKKTLLDRLVELVDNPALRKHMRKAGRIWVERYHSYEAVYSSLSKLYADHGIS